MIGDHARIATIERMARRGTLEVEHLLRLARQPSPQLADELDELAIRLDWTTGTRLPAVPFGQWVQAIGLFCREGYCGLIEAASIAEMLPFALGVLIDLKTGEALSAIIRIAESNRDNLLASPAQSKDVAGALDLATLRSPNRNLSEKDKTSGRAFLHDAFARAKTDAERGTILCAFRFFGDRSTLPLIAACPPMTAEWESARTAAVRAIRKATNQQVASG